MTWQITLGLVAIITGTIAWSRAVVARNRANGNLYKAIAERKRASLELEEARIFHAVANDILEQARAMYQEQHS